MILFVENIHTFLVPVAYGTLPGSKYSLFKLKKVVSLFLSIDGGRRQVPVDLCAFQIAFASRENFDVCELC